MELVSLRCITSRIEEKKTFYACYQLGPFSIGHSLTVANTLRRSLLTELTGLAIIEVEFQGVMHEYSVLPGIRESILEILLNLKQIVFTSKNRIQRPVYGYLKTYGPGIVKAKSFKLPAYIQCVDPEQYIATLSYDGFLSLKFVLIQGTRYSSNYPQTVQKAALNQNSLNNYTTRSYIQNQNFFVVNENKTKFQRVSHYQKKEIDQKEKFENKQSRDLEKNNIIITLDTVFVPIKKVNFSIEIDEKLHKPKEFILFEIWTNGSIHPRQALHDAAKQLLLTFYPIQKAISLNRLKKFLPVLAKKKIKRKNFKKSNLLYQKTAKKNFFFFSKKRKVLVTQLLQNL